MHKPPSYAWLLLLPVLLLTACDSSSNDPGESERIVAGVDLDVLFAPPTAAEIAAVEANWATRDVSAREVRVDSTFAFDLGGRPSTIRVVSHSVDGFRQYGLLIVPDGAGDRELPVIVLAHGGDDGIGLFLPTDPANDINLLLPLGLEDAWTEFAYVIPAYRGEPLIVGARTWLSEGPPSPWDYDVDGALALLNVMLDTVPSADPERIGILGYSRGSSVALLMATRDARIRRIVDFFGPTDFFDASIQDLTTAALQGQVLDLPGVDVLNENVIFALRDGTLSMDAARLELVRRSPVLFAERLPEVQAHHGTADELVDVSQTERLIEAMDRLGRTAPAFEAFIYEGGTHNPITLPESTRRSSNFLSGLLIDTQ